MDNLNHGADLAGNLMGPALAIHVGCGADPSKPDTEKEVRRLEEKGLVPKGHISMFWPAEYDGADWLKKTIGAGKTKEQIAAIVERIAARGQRVLVTRTTSDVHRLGPYGEHPGCGCTAR